MSVIFAKFKSRKNQPVTMEARTGNKRGCGRALVEGGDVLCLDLGGGDTCENRRAG